VRPARALPPRLHADGSARTIELANTGTAAAVFHVRPAGADPRTYTVGPGRRLTATFAGDDVEVHGPNGFYRQFLGSGPLQVSATYDERRMELTLELRNTGTSRLRLEVRDSYTGRATKLTLERHGRVTRAWSLRHAGGWYDLLLTRTDVDDFAIHYAGHLENGQDSISDPLLGSAR
jgi:phospholipase C